MDLVFVDTSVLLYRLDSTEPEKQRAAHDWLDALWVHRRARVSWQVLIEFYNNILNTLPGVPVDLARRTVGLYAQWRPIPPDIAMFRRAWDLLDRYSLSWWDALIVAAAISGGCRFLLTEDLQSGQDFDGLLVVSPFETEPNVILSP